MTHYQEIEAEAREHVRSVLDDLWFTFTEDYGGWEEPPDYPWQSWMSVHDIEDRGLARVVRRVYDQEFQRFIGDKQHDVFGFVVPEFVEWIKIGEVEAAMDWQKLYS